MEKSTDCNKTGKPVRIIDCSENSFKLQKEDLQNILCSDEVKDMPVCVVSVAGAFRKGKSFLLSMLLRYLMKKDLMTQHNKPFKGFEWKKSAHRQTTGILAWSELFFVESKDKQKVAVMLLDTQGTFDTQTTMKESARLFGLSALLSSVLIFNVSQNIQEDDLQHLGVFTEYGRLALDETNCKPFQTLLFLVRDWIHRKQYNFGKDGGLKFLNKIFEIEKRDEEMREVRKQIDSCFEDKQCFLLPNPGTTVVNKEDFDGNLKDIDKDFTTNVISLAEILFSPSTILRKTIKGKPITCQMLFASFQAYVEVFEKDSIPAPKTLLQATAELHVFKLLDDARQFITTELVKFQGRATNVYILDEDLKNLMTSLEKKVIKRFVTPPLSGTSMEDLFRQKLKNLIQEEEEKLEIRNEKHCPYLANFVSAVPAFFATTYLKVRKWGLNSEEKSVLVATKKRQIKAKCMKWISKIRRHKSVLFSEEKDNRNDTQSNDTEEPLNEVDADQHHPGRNGTNANRQTAIRSSHIFQILFSVASFIVLLGILFGTISSVGLWLCSFIFLH